MSLKSQIFLLYTIYCLLFTIPAFAETKEFTLTITDGEIELNGTKFMVWKYNDVFPGPEIRVKEGDVVKVKLRNKSSAKHGLFFHGLHVNPRVALQEQEIFVDPGYEYTYGEFVARPAGTHLYHCSWNMAEHLSRGLYGAFIVEAQDEARADREFVFIFNDWNSKVEKSEGHYGAGHPRIMIDNDITTINERVVTAGGPFTVDIKKGERIRMRLANIGQLPHTIRSVEGFTVTYEDGYRIAEPRLQDSLTIYPGKRHDITITVEKSGNFPFYHSITFPPSFIEYKSHQEGRDKHSDDDINKPAKEDVIFIINAKNR